MTENSMKFIAAIILLAISPGCAQMPICPEIKLTVCPAQGVQK